MWLRLLLVQVIKDVAKDACEEVFKMFKSQQGQIY